MIDRLAIQMSPQSEEKEMIKRVYEDNGMKLASRALKLILDDVRKLDNKQETK